jgi:acetate---CoA ligase (ADP-forming)
MRMTDGWCSGGSAEAEADAVEFKGHGDAATTRGLPDQPADESEERDQARAERMHALMSPRSVAVVGASAGRVSRANGVLQNLRTMGYAGDVYAVNPKYQEVNGVSCFSSVSELPQPVDSVVVCVRPASVADALEDAYSAGVRAAVVITSGFGESGKDEARVRQIRDLADRGMLICGPNCYGILNLKTGAATFNGTVSPEMFPGAVGVVSQSGGLGNQIATALMTDRRTGCSIVVSCGNQLGVTVEDYIQYMIEDKDTRVIAAYVEQFRQPWRLPGLAVSARTQNKPIIIHKAGQTEAGRAAVLSHTGSIAGPSVLLSSLMRRYGYIQAAGIDQLIETASLFATLGGQHGRATSRKIFVLGGGGGGAVHACDVAESVGLSLAALSPQTTEALAGMMPEFGAARNPVDGTGAIFEDRELFKKMLRAVVRDPHEGVIAVQSGARPHSSTSPTFLKSTPNDFIEDLVDVASESDKVIIAYDTCSIGAHDPQIIEKLKSRRIPYIGGTRHAMQAIADLAAYGGVRLPPTSDLLRTPPRHRVSAENGSRVLPFRSARDVLSKWGIQFLPTDTANDAEHAVRVAERIGFPVVLKGEAPGLVHKSDIGAVVTGCEDAQEVRSAYQRIITNLRNHKARDSRQVLVQAMSKYEFEALVGVTVDPDVGPAVVFGLGGLFTEVLNDAVTEVAPLDMDRARGMVGSIHASKILSGARGRGPLDVEGIASTLVSLSELSLEYRDRLVAIDINPLFVGPAGEGVVAADVVMELAGPE